MTNKYEMVGGLEIHVRLKTKTKLFCGCSNDTFATEANSLICPVCAALPGALPVINREAFYMALKTALALNCQIPAFSKFDRKSYFYPDLPAGFQISQFDEPFALGGAVEVFVNEEKKRFALTRIHMENDAGKLTHEGAHSSLVDWNRAGSPLIEIVTEPVFRSPDEIFEFLKELQRILRFLGTSDADMEKGMMRCDVNISLRPSGQEVFGTKVELKNMNSFGNVKKATEYEIARQKKILEKGEKIVQETRGFDADKGITVGQREKEESADYRYFPEPDLPPLTIDAQKIVEIKREVPELPARKTERFVEECGLPFAQAQTLAGEQGLADFFEAVSAVAKNPQKSANWILGDYLALTKEHPEKQMAPANLGKLILLTENGKISGKIAKEIFPIIFTTDADPEAYVEKNNLSQIADSGAVEAICTAVIAENSQIVADFKGGKEKALGALIGKVMQKSAGQASPPLVNEILRKLLD